MGAMLDSNAKRSLRRLRRWGRDNARELAFYSLPVLIGLVALILALRVLIPS
jgi:hypothetical protein